MNWTRPLALLLLLALGALLGGCTGKTDEDSQVPWAAPARWEGTVPGMPTGPGY